MATFFERLELIVDANVAGAVKGLGLTSAQAGTLDKKTRSLGQAMPYVAAGAVAIGAGLWASVKAYGESERATIRLQNSLKNNPLLAGESADAFLKQASAIQSNTVAADEQVVAAQAMLGTFRLTKSEILGLTPLVVDYARKFGTDLETASKQVGKAMDGQVGALKRNGVTIDETMFKTDRYRAVMEALRGQVGGFAEAEANTAEGKIAQLGNRLNDLMEVIGGGVAPAITTLVGGFMDVVDGIDSVLSPLGGLTKAVELYYKALISPALLAKEAFDLVGDALDEVFGGGLEVKAKSLKEALEQTPDWAKDYVESAHQATQADEDHGAAVQALLSKIKAKTDAVWAGIDAERTAAGATLSAQEAQERYNAVLSDPESSPLERARAEFSLGDALIASAKANGAAAAAALGNATEGEKARASALAQVDALTGLANSAAPGSPLQQNLLSYRAQLVASSGVYTAVLLADTSPAERALAIFRNNASQWASVPISVKVEAFGNIFGRAAGGPVKKGQPYIVGEHRPELFVPEQSGRILPRVPAMSGGGSGGGGGTSQVNINVTVPVGADAVSAGREISYALDAYYRRMGRNN